MFPFFCIIILSFYHRIPSRSDNNYYTVFLFDTSKQLWQNNQNAYTIYSLLRGRVDILTLMFKMLYHMVMSLNYCHIHLSWPRKLYPKFPTWSEILLRINGSMSGTEIYLIVVINISSTCLTISVFRVCFHVINDLWFLLLYIKCSITVFIWYITKLFLCNIRRHIVLKK